jgi:hypothetical protein
MSDNDITNNTNEILNRMENDITNNTNENVNTTENELPIIVLITNKNCKHCIEFRGTDGMPSPEKAWNNNYIRSLLMDSESGSDRNGRPKKLRACVVVEINVATTGRNIDNIGELNLYSIIPSIDEIEQYFRNYGGSHKFFDSSKISGTAVERINIKREAFNRINIQVHVNSIFSPHLTEFYTNEYIWKLVPPQVEILRQYVISRLPIPDELLDEIGNPDLKNFIRTNEQNIYADVNFFDNEITSRFYGFPWLLSKILPVRIRDYEDKYPRWLLVSPSEWRNSLTYQSAIYAIATNDKTYLNGDKYVTETYTRGERIETLLERYKNVPIRYEPPKSKPTFNWSIHTK